MQENLSSICEDCGYIKRVELKKYKENNILGTFYCAFYYIRIYYTGEVIMDINLIKTLLIISCVSSIISSSFTQKIKGTSIIKCSSCLIYISFFISMIFGIIFTLTFTHYGIIESLWVGLFSFLGADKLYKILEDKVFKSYSNINKK